MSEENDFSCINDLPCEEYIIYFIYLFILLLFFFQISYRVLFLSFFIYLLFFFSLSFIFKPIVCVYGEEREGRGRRRGESGGDMKKRCQMI